MMINVNECFAVFNGLSHDAQALECCAVCCNHQVKFAVPPRFLNNLVRIKKCVFIGDTVLVPTFHLFTLVTQCERQRQLRTNAITVGPYVANDANCAALANVIQNAIYNFGMGFHGNRLW